MKKLINLAIGISFIGLLLWNPYPFKLLELKSFDWMLSTQGRFQNTNILIVDLDEETVKEYGGYPLPRSLYADLIKKTNAVPGITVLMPDPDIRGGNNDKKLKEAMDRVPTVLAYAASIQASEGGPHVGTAQIGEDPKNFLFRYLGILRQTEVLGETVKGVGLITSAPEIDGVVRRVPLAVSAQGGIYPSFALEMLRVGVGDPSYQIKTGQAGIEWLRIPNYPTINTDANARVWMTSNIDFYRQSAKEYLENPITGASFVIFGVTAEGVVNPVPTAKGMVYPHEVQANVLHHLILGTSPTEPIWTQTAELGAAIGLVLLLLLTASNVFFSLPVLIASFIGLYYGALYYFVQGYLVDISGVLVIGFLYWTVLTFRSFIEQFFLRRQVKKQFGTYLSPDMVKMLQKDPSLLRLGGERKEMTFLFTDIMGFTPVSEVYKNNDDPEGLVDLINTYLDSMTKIILNNGGTIDKYMGDCIMAFWNAPLDCENHADMAVKSAIEINKKTEELNKQFKEEDLGLPPINVGTGINTGTCIVGNMGSEVRFDYSVIGDAVNLAARLEATAGRNDYKEWKIIVSDSTMKKCKEFDFDSIGDIKVKGKEELITIYSPLNVRSLT
jgi:adenylate cyclase